MNWKDNLLNSLEELGVDYDSLVDEANLFGDEFYEAYEVSKKESQKMSSEKIRYKKLREKPYDELTSEQKEFYDYYTEVVLDGRGAR